MYSICKILIYSADDTRMKEAKTQKQPKMDLVISISHHLIVILRIQYPSTYDKVWIKCNLWYKCGSASKEVSDKVLLCHLIFSSFVSIFYPLCFVKLRWLNKWWELDLIRIHLVSLTYYILMTFCYFLRLPLMLF